MENANGAIVKTSKRRESDEKQNFNDALIHNVVEQSFYDCIEINEQWLNGYRLFGNSNIGNLDLTNLQIPGQMPGDRAFLIGGWHARTNLPETGRARDLFMVLAQHVHATLMIGSRFQMVDALASLLRPNRPRSWPSFVPCRQQFSVSIDRFNSLAFDDLLDELRRTDAGRALYPGPRFWIHLDGLVVDDRDGAQLIERVHRHMIHVETETRSVEQRIVDWVSSNNVPGDDASAAQLQAICDGILEGRWKS